MRRCTAVSRVCLCLPVLFRLKLLKSLTYKTSFRYAHTSSEYPGQVCNLMLSGQVKVTLAKRSKERN